MSRCLDGPADCGFASKDKGNATAAETRMFEKDFLNRGEVDHGAARFRTAARVARDPRSLRREHACLCHAPCRAIFELRAGHCRSIENCRESPVDGHVRGTLKRCMRGKAKSWRSSPEMNC